MLLQPRKFRYKKNHKLKNITDRVEHSAIHLEFGLHGLKFIESGTVTAREMEACRKIIARNLKKSGKYWFRIFPTLGITKKPAEIRMGKGKGNVDHWGYLTKKGQIFCEISGVSTNIAKSLLLAVAKKLALPTKFIAFDA